MNAFVLVGMGSSILLYLQRNDPLIMDILIVENYFMILNFLLLLKILIDAKSPIKDMLEDNKWKVIYYHVLLLVEAFCLTSPNFLGLLLLTTIGLIIYIKSQHVNSTGTFSNGRSLLIIGSDERDFSYLASYFETHIEKSWRIEGCIDTDTSEVEAKLLNASSVLISNDSPIKEDIFRKCKDAGKEILIVPSWSDIQMIKSRPKRVGDMLLISYGKAGLTDLQNILKRSFDVFVSIFLITILSPVVVLLIFGITITSSGGPLYKQVRIGFHGELFTIYKFRSMIQNAEKLSGPVLARDKDPRITSIGKFMRQTRLDEIPQLYNVLKGDMSLIGPRPERPYFTDQYIKTIPNFTDRLLVRPGITGLAQINGKYTTIPEDKLRFDLMYILNYSFALDVKILMRTIGIVFQKQKATGIEDTVLAQKETASHN
ncbi:sugar transferase [Alkalihalobacillus sp. R86527]|uniref:sugar transferase n=1 Tax=Alkalihalobacillus sp. R86527 TaxID=3093863 RepID=UPI003670F171